MSTPGSIGSEGRAAGPSAIEHSIECFIDQAVGVGVALAPDVADRPGVEFPQRSSHLFVQSLHAGVFDFVAAFDLPHNQLRVADQLQVGGAVRGGQLDPPQQRRVLSDVVRRLADLLPHLLQHLAAVVADDHADSRRAGVAAGAPVDVDGDPAHRLAACSPASASTPSSPTQAFQWQAAWSSWSSSRPLSIWKTGRSSSPMSTPHWYQESSQATVTRTSFGAPAAAPTEANGLPRVRVRPATVCPASLELKRATARSKGVGPSPGAGVIRGRRSRQRPSWPSTGRSGSGSPAASHPRRSARATQSSQTERSSTSTKP